MTDKKEKDEITLLVGNGLCRAFEKDANVTFDLNEILANVWQNKLEDSIKEILRKIVPPHGPQNEKGLGYVKQFLESIEFFFEEKRNGKYCISQCVNSIEFSLSKGLTLPQITISECCKMKEAYQALEKEVLEKLQEDSNSVSDKFKKWFENGFNNFLLKNKVNIATLNYDDLLYRAIFSSKDNEKFQEKFTDGFKETVFNRWEFYEWVRQGRSRYCHLHGSYLFSKEREDIKKHCSGNSLPEHPLVILTSQSNKQEKLLGEVILRIYHRHFLEAISQSKRLIIIGYSGRDKYLNEELRYATAKNKLLQITVIQWHKPGLNEESCIGEWNEKLSLKKDRFLKKIDEKDLSSQSGIFFLEDIRKSPWNKMTKEI